MVQVAKRETLSDTQQVTYLSTSVGKFCSHCSGELLGLDRFGESVNHLIEKHGYRLLHVGQETTRGDDGNGWHSTVAVLGLEAIG